MSDEITRRQALGLAGIGALLGGAKILEGTPTGEAEVLRLPLSAERTQDPAPQLPPVGELVNAFDFEQGARATLPAEVFAAIGGGDRGAFDRMTFRPRMNISATGMDLSVTLLGETLYTPVIVGPFADHGAYHPEGELATLRGATQSLAPLVVSRHSTVSFEALAADGAAIPLWFSVYADDADGVSYARRAAQAGARAVFLTVRASYSPTGGEPRAGSAIDWGRVESFVGAVEVPLVIKGIMTPAEAERAISLGTSGLVVSTHGSPDAPSPVDLLPAVVDAVGGRVPVLVDGSFRRGTDVLKGVVLGAQGVLLGRPIAWGLAAYGADGVNYVLRLIQNEMARSMAMLGTPTLADLTRSHVRRHSRATS